MPSVENDTEFYARPRARRAKSQLNACQDCSAELTLENWSPSMRGDGGQRPRYICRFCWTTRQRKYDSRKDPVKLLEMKNAARIKRQSKWSEDRKEAERIRQYGSYLKRVYGISIQDYDRLYQLQAGRCAICRTDRPNGRGVFHVDHCHDSGTIRGLLCAGCNLMLGIMRDSQENLMRAVEYLKASTNGKRY